MRVEQVMFRSGAVRRAGDHYFPDGADGVPPRNTITGPHPVPAGAADLKGAQSDDYDIS